MKYLFAFLAFICGVFIKSKFTKGQRDKYPILKKLDGKQIYLISFTIIFSAISFGIYAIQDEQSVKSELELLHGYNGELNQRASTFGFEKELEDAAKERKTEARDYFNAAETDFSSWRYKEAINNYQNSIKSLPTMSAYLNMGHAFLYDSDFQGAKDAFASGLTIAQDKDNKLFVGAFSGSIGLVYIDQGNIGAGMKYSTTALEIFRSIEYLEGEANVLITIGNVYLKQGNLDEASEIYSEINEMNKQLKNSEIEVVILLNTGVLHLENKEFEKALEYFYEAIEINEILKNPDLQANALLNIGIVYDNKENFDEAFNYSWESVKIYEMIGNDIGQAYALLNIGCIYNNQKNTTESLKYSQVALEIFNNTGHKMGEAEALYTIGLVNLNQGNKPKAIEKLKQAQLIYEMVGAIKKSEIIENIILKLNSTVTSM
ncbi:MAG: tetratricopeptide repeat protein [Spirochaetes bacterium]|nr:tetratricopeptide repeat protein [Spirochaetota bacterium]